MVTSIRSLPDSVEVEGVPEVSVVEGAFMGCASHISFRGILLQADSYYLNHCLTIRKKLVAVGAVVVVEDTGF
jgi:hypothetical protein